MRKIGFAGRCLAIGLVWLGMSELASPQAEAQVLYSTQGVVYSENFNGLATSGTSSTRPSGWLQSETGSAANTSYHADNGAASTGGVISYGTGTNTDRAFGTLRSSTITSAMIGTAFVNNTGATLTQFSITYTGEEWRYGGGSGADYLDFQYSTNATSLTTGSWWDVDTLDFATPQLFSLGSHDGNNSQNRLTISGKLPAFSLAQGSVLWIRWVDRDRASAEDDGLAIDDFQFVATDGHVTKPEPWVYPTAGELRIQGFQSMNNPRPPGLEMTGTSGSALPVGWGLKDAKPSTVYDISDGSSQTASIYSFGTVGSPSRTLGSIGEYDFAGSPTREHLFGVRVRNTTGATLNTFTVRYFARQWRLAQAGRADRLDFQYSLTATALDTSTANTWIDVNALDFSSPNTTTVGALDGNAEENSRYVIASVPGISWPAGTDLWIRWVDANVGGEDDGLGLSLFVFSANATSAVELMDFKALAVSGGVWLKWKTGLEVDNVGFNVYRQRKRDDGSWGPKVKLNPALIAAAALQTNPRVDKDGGYLYGWPDPNPGDLMRFRYYLEDVDTYGRKEEHGPVRPQAGSGSLADRVKSPLISEVGP